MQKVSNNKRQKVDEGEASDATNSKFEIFYFPMQGRAEYVRLVLAFAKADWESKNVEDWAKEKTSTKGLLFKQVPMLIETTASGDEHRLVQTGTIIRYLAKKFSKYKWRPFFFLIEFYNDCIIKFHFFFFLKKIYIYNY